MNKTITVYELLGMIKDGKAPKKIKYDKVTLIIDEYLRICGKDGRPCIWQIDNDFLNETVEIIEDNDKIDEEAKPITKESIEALGYACGEFQKCFTNGWTKALENKPLKDNDKLEKIEKLDDRHYDEVNKCFCGRQMLGETVLVDKINEIIDHINKLEDNQ